MRTPSRYRRAGGPAGTSPGDLREVLNGGTLERLAETEDRGHVQTGYVEHPDGTAAVEVDADLHEVRVWIVDVVTGHPVLATLYAPANALWRKPPAGDTATVLTGAHTGAPAAATAFHGDGAAPDAAKPQAVPADLTDTNTVLSPPTGDVLVQSRDGQVVITSNRNGTTSAKITLNPDGSAVVRSGGGATATLRADGSVDVSAATGKDLTFNGGTAKVGRVGDPVNAGTVTAVAGPYPVQFIYTPVVGAPVGPSPTLAMTGGQITDGAPHTKG